MPSKPPKSGQSSRLHTAKPRAGRKRLKTEYLPCAQRKGTAKCSILGSTLYFCAQGCQCSPSPHLHTWKTREAYLPIPTSSAPAGWQAESFPGYSSAWKRDLEKAASCILLAGRTRVTPLGRKKAPGVTMRKWAPKCLSTGLPRLGLLWASTFLCTAVMMWGPRTAGARKISNSYCGYLLPYFGNLISQVAANRVIWIQLLAEMHMKSEVFFGQSLLNVRSTTGLSGEGWGRGALEEGLASSSHLAGCLDGIPQCWQTRPRAVKLLLYPSGP